MTDAKILRKAIYVACLILMIVPLTDCTAGGWNAPLATQTFVPPAYSATVETQAATDTPAPQSAAAYPDQPTSDIGYPPPGDTPGPESSYPAEVLTQTAKVLTAMQVPTTAVTIPATPGTPTITPFPVSETQPELPHPCDVYQGMNSYPTTALKDLRWEKVRVDGKPFDRLTGLSAPSGPAWPSPDGSGVALSIFLSFDNVSLSGVYGLLVVDGPGGTPWWAVQSAMGDNLAFQWLPGNRLSWIDKGELYSAQADGSKKVDYHAPEPVHQIWSNGSIAMVSGRQHLWLLDLATRTWTMKVENLGSPFASAMLMPGGETLLINNSGELMQVPMDPRGEITRYKKLAYAGSGGMHSSPIAMAGGPYIYPGVMELVGGDDPRLRFVVFKEGEYEPIDLEELIGKAEVHSIYAVDVSPDGNWVLLPFNGSDLATQETQYLAPANDLQAGRLVTGSTVGWRENPAAVLLTTGETIRQVSLPSFEEKILGRFALMNDRPYLAGTTIGPNITVIRINNRLHLFDAPGNLKGQIDLPHHPRQIYSLVADKNDTFYLTGWDGKANGNVCEATYWMEIVDCRK